MVAVMEKLEPEGLGHELLEEYALFARGDGESRDSWSVKDRIDPVHDGEPPDRWYIVHEIVAQHKKSTDGFWDHVARKYLGQMPYWLMERELNKSEYSIRTTLCWCCELIRREYLDIRNQ